MNESKFTEKVKNWLMSRGIYEAGTGKHKIDKVNGWFFKVWGGGFQRAGIPDILCCIRGRFVALELKSSTGNPTALQKKNVKMINEAAGVAMVVYPEEFEELKITINNLIEREKIGNE